MFLGLLAAVVGAWALHHLRDATNTCVPGVTHSEIFGVTTSCLNQVGLEYVSMGILLAGMFTFVFALLLMKKQRNSKSIAMDGGRRLIGTPGESPELRQHFSVQFRKRGGSESAPSEGSGPRTEDGKTSDK